jgi:hypothetical protein
MKKPATPYRIFRAIMTRSHKAPERSDEPTLHTGPLQAQPIDWNEIDAISGATCAPDDDSHTRQTR